MGGYGMAAKMRELTEQNIQEFVKEVEKRKIPLHSVLIAQHGNLLFEKYYAPYCRNKLQRMFSVTKSFTSLAIGFVLELTGYVPNAVQSLSTQNSIRVLMCIVPTIGVILAYIVYKNKYKLSDEFMKKVISKITGSSTSSEQE